MQAQQLVLDRLAEPLAVFGLDMTLCPVLHVGDGLFLVHTLAHDRSDNFTQVLPVPQAERVRERNRPCLVSTSSG